MGEEDVKIPISLEVDKRELQELKADIDKTFSKVKDYEQSWSTKKEPFKLGDTAKTESNIQSIISEMERLQRQFDTVSKSSPAADLLKIQKEIGETIKASNIDLKSQQSAQAKLAVYSREQKKYLAEANSIQKDIDKRQNEYIAARAKIDTTKKGSKAEFKELEKQYAAEMETLNERLRTAKSSETVYRTQADQARHEVESLKSAGAERAKSLADLRSQASELGKLVKSEDYVKQKEAERVATLKRINNELAKQRDLLLEAQNSAESQLAADMERTGKRTGKTSRHDKAIETAERNAQRQEEAELSTRERVLLEEQKIRRALANEISRANRAEAKAVEDNIKSRVASINKEISAVKQSAAQYYYKLRAVKMLGFVINSTYSTIDRFGKKSLEVAKKSLNAYLKLIPGVNALRRALSGANAEQKKLSRETNKSAKANAGLNTSFKGLIKSILAYGLGIRSVYVLFNRLRKAVTDGLGSMAKQISDVNMQMSSVVTSMNQMKASVTAAIQPILSVLAPALERVAAAIAEIAYQVASFIAALTGQSVVYRAARVWTDYAASLDKTGKSAKKAKKELAGFDELNVLHTDDKSGGDDFGGMSWDPVEPSKKAQKLADKIKEIFKRLYAPIKAAWDKIGRYVVLSWKYAIDNVKALGESMARDFWRVWEEYDTQAIFEDMFRIIGDVGRIVGNLAKNLKTAWDEAENGYRILASIRDVIGIIVHGISECTFYTIKWADELTFIPLLTALADNMQGKLVPAVQKVVDLFKTLYEDILLKIIKDFIEKGLPQIVNIVGNLITAVGNLADNLNSALQNNAMGVKIIEDAEALLQIIADTIERCSEKTAEWASHLNFTPLLESADNFLKESEPLITAISQALSDLWNNTLLPFWQYLIEEGFPKLLDALTEITGGDWSAFTENARSLTEALEPFFELAWETLVQILKDVGLALKDFLNSNELRSIIDNFKDWAENADPEELANKIENFTKNIIGATAALALFSKVVFPIITGYMTIVNFIKQGIMFKQVGQLTKIIKGLTETAPGIAEVTTESLQFAGALTKWTGIGSIIAGIVLGIKNFFSMWTEGVTPVKTAIEALAGALVGLGLVILGIAAWPAVVIGALVGLAVAIVALVHEHWEEIKTFFVQTIPAWWNGTALPFIQSIPEKIREFFDKLPEYARELGEKIGEKLGELAGKIYNTAKEIGAWWTNTAWPWIKSLPGKVWEGLKAIGTKISEFIKSIPGKLAELKTTVSNWWTGTAWPWITGLPKKIVDGFKKGLDTFKESVANFGKGLFSGFKKGFEKEADINSPSRAMEKDGEYLIGGLSNGVDNAWRVFNANIQKSLSSLMSLFKSVLSNSVLQSIGTNFINGLINGVASGMSTLLGRISSYASSIRSYFSSSLSSGSLVNTGYNLLVGLINGMIDGFNRAYQRVREGCSNIINIAKSVFSIHSPSKVFEDIGQKDMEGLSGGIEKGADATASVMEDAMKDLVPDTSDNFANNFLDTLTTMKQDAISIINSMVDEMSTSMGNLDSLFSSGNWGMASQLGKLSTISIPNIAQGKTLPSTAQFSQATSGEEFDYNRLANVLSSAIVDAMGASSYNNTNSGDTIISIDGREIFRAVRKQNDIYRKSTGKTAF